MLSAVAFRAFQSMDPEQLGNTIAAAQADVDARGEKYTGPNYIGGAPQKSLFPTKQMSQTGPLEGQFGSGLNAKGKGDERVKRAKELAQMWATQWSNGPFGPDVVPGAEPAPASKEQA